MQWCLGPLSRPPQPCGVPWRSLWRQEHRGDLEGTELHITWYHHPVKPCRTRQAFQRDQGRAASCIGCFDTPQLPSLVLFLELHKHTRLLMHPIAVRLPLLLRRSPLQLESPQHLRHQLAHLHERNVLANAGAHAIPELQSISTLNLTIRSSGNDMGLPQRNSAP